MNVYKIVKCEMKHEFEASVLCNESEFPTYPLPPVVAANKNARAHLNWSFMEPSTSANLNHVSFSIYFSSRNKFFNIPIVFEDSAYI